MTSILDQRAAEADARKGVKDKKDAQKAANESVGKAFRDRGANMCRPRAGPELEYGVARGASRRAGCDSGNRRGNNSTGPSSPSPPPPLPFEINRKVPSMIELMNTLELPHKRWGEIVDYDAELSEDSEKDPTKEYKGGVIPWDVMTKMAGLTKEEYLTIFFREWEGNKVPVDKAVLFVKEMLYFLSGTLPLGPNGNRFKGGMTAWKKQEWPGLGHDVLGDLQKHYGVAETTLDEVVPRAFLETYCAG